jgi:pimeloyl-ACP methyl ester carboxylesterase
MDTSASELKQSHRIKGPVGFLYVDDGGAGNIPVVFIHSFGGNISHWTHQLEHLRTNRRAIAFDLRGHGRSDSSDHNYFAESLAGDISAVVDSLYLDRFVLVGHSMGGIAAIAYADTHPGRVAGLVLVGTPGKTPSEQSKPIIASLESDDWQKVMDDYMKQLLANAKPKVDSLVMNDSRKLSKETSISIIKAMFQYNPITALNRYKGSKLIISTSRESKQSNALHNQAPDVTNKTIEGTSHWIQMDKPDEFNRVLDDFLKTVEK